MKEKQKLLIIYNPKAGKDSLRPSSSQITSLFPAEKYALTVFETKGAGDATTIAQSNAADFDIIVCCGGDGTLNETINGVMKSEARPKIGYIPIGSTNDLASTLLIPSSFEEAARLIMSGKTNKYDIGSFNGMFFDYVACFGFGTHVSYSTSQKVKNKLGYSAYMINGFVLNVIPMLKQMKSKHVRIEYDGQILEDDFYFGAVTNSTSVAGMFKFDKNSLRLNDGKFEIMLVRRIKKPIDVFKMFAKVKRCDYDGDTLIQLKASDIKMTFNSPECWSVDGERVEGTNDIEIKVNNNAVEIFSPENALFIKETETAMQK